MSLLADGRPAAVSRSPPSESRIKPRLGSQQQCPVPGSMIPPYGAWANAVKGSTAEGTKALFAVGWIASRSLSSGAHSRDPLAPTRGLASNDDQIPATDDHISDSLCLSEANRVNGTASSSSSGRRRPPVVH